MRPFHHILFLLSTIGILFFSSVYVSAYGHIPVMNYQRTDYTFGTQNWDMTQDLFGKVYMANYNGMLVFDGQRWQRYYLPNFSTVRSLYYDRETDRIYAGGTEEFGYYAPDKVSGRLFYTSLSEKLPQDKKMFSEVWDIMAINGNMIFRCDNCIFHYSNGSLQRLNIPGRISASSVIGRKVFLGLENGKVLSLKEGDLKELREEACLENKKIVALMPFDDNAILLGTPFSGLFIMRNNTVEPYKKSFSDYLKSGQIFCGNYRNGTYVFGTVTGGALIWNSNTDAIHIINKASGMKNNTVLNTGFDLNGNLWLCLDNGVAYAALDSPCRRLIGENSFIGAGYASAISGNNLLLGTNQGLYLIDMQQGETIDNPVPHPLLQGQVWSITPVGKSFFISTDRGLYLYDENTLIKIEGVPGVYKTLPLNGNTGMALASTYESFHLLEKNAGSWHDKGKIGGGNGLTGDFIIDDENRVWLSHWQKGIYLLPFNITESRFTSCSLYNKENGLPADDNNTLAFFEGSPLLSTYQGFFTLSSNKAIRIDEMSELLPEGRKGHLKELSDGSVALIDEQGLMLICKKPEGGYEKNEISGPDLYHEIIPGFTDIKKFNRDALLVSTQAGFTLVNTGSSQPFPHSSKPFVSSVFANQDSLVYLSPLSPDNPRDLRLPHHLNSLRFEFAYPECSFGHNTEFSTYLENYDKDWSPFSADNSREYTKLADGKYVLHLKVKDNYSGQILESSFGFTVTPPWFRTIWAKGIYTLITFMILLLLFASVRKKMVAIRQKVEKKKEKELEELRRETERHNILKDMEIAGLKNEQLEQEIKFKSEELSATTMQLINKNEILRDIGDQISKIKQLASEGAVGSIQKNLSKLQSSIEQNLNKDKYWSTFNQNFDIVYGDYMQRLLKLHPNLSQSEKRLCCYIRMGLSSKEIAPLINISFRSVEMARYRLRKKINLAAEETLADYLVNI